MFVLGAEAEGFNAGRYGKGLRALSAMTDA